jgi:hypothetical protein
VKRESGISKLALSVAALAVLLNTPAHADPITLGVFHEFAFSTAGNPATGCDPDDPAGPFCIPNSATPTDFIGAPPLDFSSAGRRGGAHRGRRFRLW